MTTLPASLSSKESKNLPVRVASIGGFGHGVCVYDEFASLCGVRCVSMAPGYAGEDMSAFAAHPWMVASAPVQFASPSELLEKDPPDILIVSTRLDRTAEIAMQGLRAGCHLILEKPVALDLDSLRALHAAAKEAGRHVMAMLSMRSLPAFVAARDAIRQGAIGRPLLVNTRKSYKWGTRPAWFNDRALYGGTWPWIGIHNLDMANFLTGKKFVSVFATHGNVAHPALPNCEDVASGLFQMEDGLQMTACVDLCRPETAPTWGDDWCRVVGSEGILEANASCGTLTLLQASGEPRSLPIPAATDPIYTEFLERIASASPAEDTAFELTLAALAARESADIGRNLAIDHTRWTTTPL